VTISHDARDVRVFHKECRTLAAAGHEVHLFVPGPIPDGGDGVRFHALPDTGISTAYFWRIWRKLPAIYRHTRRVDAAVYHLPDPALIPLGLLLKLRGAKVVYDAHEDRPRQALTKYAAMGRPTIGWISSILWRVLEAVAKLVFDRFVAATPAISRQFPPKRTVTLYNYPRLEEFAAARRRGPLSYRDRANDVVFTGTIRRYRGVKECVQAIELVPHALHPRFVVMGDIVTAGFNFRAELETLPGWNRVEYLGTQPRDAMVERLFRARAGLVLLNSRPEHREAIGNKLFEYMAAGLPVIASNFPLWRKIIEDNRAGLTVDPHDVAAIAAAIRYLLEHPQEAEEMGARGAEAVANKYNWDAEASKLLALYDRLGTDGYGRYR
jgi:glycosyltransferase involved in cell wall biosynthesis